MIVPQYWAEGRVQYRSRDRQVTVRRYGWSEISQEDAQSKADERAKAAHERVMAGEPLARFELKVAYNGADGVPIREEVVARHGETVITRNAYGARCLNTPNVLFADLDFAEPFIRMKPIVHYVIAVVFWSAIGWFFQWSFFTMAIILGIVTALSMLTYLSKSRAGLVANEEDARRLIDRFLARHPDWHFRIYRTPAGLRLLAMHRTFDPREPAVAECFRELGTDPIYARMCFNQNCFRARIGPKPWRIGMAAHMRPRPGVWPISPERMPARQQWVAEYETKAEEFSACRFVESVGTGLEDPTARAVQRLHDDLCRATSDRPIA